VTEIVQFFAEPGVANPVRGVIGPDDPSLVAGGVDMPIGSSYVTRGTGQWNTKYGPAPSDWAKLAATSGFLPLSGGSLNPGANLGVPGALVVGTDPGTAAILRVGGAALVSGAMDAGSYKSGGSTVLFRDAVYTRLYDPAVNVAIHLGTTPDPANYYNNTTHFFRSRDGGVVFGTWAATGLIVNTYLGANAINGTSLTGGIIWANAVNDGGYFVSGQVASGSLLAGTHLATSGASGGNLNLFSRGDTGGGGFGVSIHYYDSALGGWRAAFDVRNTAGLSTLNLMPAGGNTVLGGNVIAVAATFTDTVYAQNGALLYGSDLRWNNNQWMWASVAHDQSNPNSIKLWDHYGSLGGTESQGSPPTAYGTILDLYGRSAHLHDQLFFGHNGTLYLRHAFYGTNTWSSWRQIMQDSGGTFYGAVTFSGGLTATSGSFSGAITAAGQNMAIGASAAWFMEHRDDASKIAGIYAIGGMLNLWTNVSGTALQVSSSSGNVNVINQLAVGNLLSLAATGLAVGGFDAGVFTAGGSLYLATRSTGAGLNVNYSTGNVGATHQFTVTGRLTASSGIDLYPSYGIKWQGYDGGLFADGTWTYLSRYSSIAGIRVRHSDGMLRIDAPATLANSQQFIMEPGSAFRSDTVSTSYANAVQIREAGGASNPANTGAGYAPRLAFHWGGIVASQIAIEGSARIVILNNPGTGYERFGAKTLEVAAAQAVITGGLWYEAATARLKMTGFPSGTGFGWNNGANGVEVMRLSDAGDLVVVGAVTAQNFILS
jgi:hypothetical protein